MFRTQLALCAAASLLGSMATAADTKPDPRYPFRTDFANDHLPWYKPKLLEFPPHHSDRRISGELVSADYVHRTGKFRVSKTGEIAEFTMPPYGAIDYLNASADLRDVPLGTFFMFFLNQDEDGKFTRLATMQDQYTMDAGHAFSYRLDEAKLAEGKMLATKHSIPKKQDDLGKKELLVSADTRVWKGNKQAKLEDLKPGDELLFNITGKTASSPGRCTDVWAGTDTHKQTTDAQNKKFAEFTKTRGVPGWIEKTEGNKATVTLFSGNSESFKMVSGNDFAVGKDAKLAVANDELRTWNPPVDAERGSVVAIDRVPTDCYGCSGLRITMTVSNMLEGFRRGRVVRVFGSGWPAKDELYGESLMGYGYGGLRSADFRELPPKEYPEQFPFRTDFGNRDKPWYQVKPGGVPPLFSEHVLYGELTGVDAAARTGEFRLEPTGETVKFSLLPQGATVDVNVNKPDDQGPARSKLETCSIRYLNTETALEDLPVGLRYRFHAYQDEQGKFTKVSLISDEFSHLALNVLTYRVKALVPNENKIHVGWQLPPVKNYNGDMEQPQDLGQSELTVTKETRVWKGDSQMQLKDVAVGDVLLVNRTGELPGVPSHCTDIWVGTETHQHAAEAWKKTHGGKR